MTRPGDVRAGRRRPGISRAACLELGAVEDCPVAHVASARPRRAAASGLSTTGDAALQRKDLAPPAVDHGHGPGRARGQGVQRRNTCDRSAERKREGPRGDEADAQAGVAPGPVPTAIASTASGSSPASATSACASSRTRTGLDARSPTTSPSRTRALVATSVAVSNARISTGKNALFQGFFVALQHDQSTRLPDVLQTDAAPSPAAGIPLRPAATRRRRRRRSKYSSRSPHSACDMPSNR